METNFLENNSLVLMGKVANEKTFSHEIYGEKFYQFSLSVPRLSGNADNIPITISERLFRDEDIAIGKNVKVNGQFRSYNGYENNKNRLVLTVFVKDIEFLPDGDEVLTDKDVVSNEVDLTGFICKPPIYRQTPFGREITDILIAVNRAYNKSDYIPCIAWGRNARFCSKMPVGTEVKVTGRVQSRNYEKKYEDGTVEQRVAYEVSVSNLEVVNGEVAEETPAEEAAE
jgi:single-stranded DNA-binding protein